MTTGRQSGVARKLYAVVRVAALITAGLTSAATAVEWNLYHHISAPQFVTSRGAKLLAEEIESQTGGEVKVRLHLAGTLQISASDVAVAVGSNTVQMGDDLFNSGAIPAAGIPRLPMLIQSYEELEKAAAVLRPFIAKAYAEKGSTLIGDYIYPLQVMWARKPVGKLEDIKGMKIRVSQPEQGEFVRRFGGTSITISAPEVPSALDRGVVDGIFTAGIGAVLWKDQLKSGYLLPVNLNNSYIIVNTEAFNKLSPAQQGKVRSAGEKIARWNLDNARQEEAASVKTLAAAGYAIVDPPKEDYAKAVEAVKSYWDEWAKSRRPEVQEALAKVRAALGR